MSENLFTPKRFLAFVESKDPNEIYNYWDSANCACAQFYHSLGLDYQTGNPSMDLEYLAIGAVKNISVRDTFAIVTFGELAKYIRQMHPELN